MPLKLRAVNKRSSSMANEELDKLIEDVPEDNEPVEEVVEETPAEEKPAEKPEEEVTAEEVKETESQVEKLFEKPEKKDHLKGTVPVEDHVKLRQRAQAAEAKLAQYEATQQPVESAVLDEISELLSGDDEYAEKAKLREAFNKLPKVIAQIANKTTSEALGNVQMQNIAAKARADEATFKKDNPDYDTIVGFAARHKLLSTDELKEIFASDNIAETYYNKAKAAVEMERTALLGNPPSKPTTENNQQPTGDDTEFKDDDEAFDYMLSAGS
jgi:hypothetical protein